MKYVIKLGYLETALAETTFLDIAKQIAEMLYKKNEGRNVIYIEEVPEYTIVKGRFSYDGYKDYSEIGSE